MTTLSPAKGWCPWAIHRPVAAQKFSPGNTGRAAVVLHVSGGTIESLLNWFANGSEASAHFGIGPDGSLYQFVSIHDTAYGNGASYYHGQWHDPQGHLVQPSWVGLRHGENPNRYTISIEHAGQPADYWKDAMRETNRRLLIWLAEQYPSLAPYVPKYTLIGHCEISPVSRPYCPGPYVDYATIASAVNASLPGAPAPTGADVTPDSAILAPARARPEQATDYMLGHSHGDYSDYDIGQIIVPTYWQVCESVGVDPLVTVAQMIHETGNLTSYWSQRERRNPAGIGITGAPGKGVSFPTWKDHAIPAHVGRLLAYMLRDSDATAVQLKLIATALSYRALPAEYRAAVTTLRGLQGRWAVPGTDYASKIAAIANAIRAR